MDWQHFTFFAGLIAGWSLVIIATARWAINASMKAVALKIDEHSNELKSQGQKQQSLEREVLEIKADLPLCYVRREDFIRHEVTINTKLDRLRDMIQDLAGKEKE
ncbi:MAG: hypothetical protein NTY64_22985 [Deltaproteobacteria bacterium]|nr:hypothetical protein [Deltaproteobacteria bacterium]